MNKKKKIGEDSSHKNGIIHQLPFWLLKLEPHLVFSNVMLELTEYPAEVRGRLGVWADAMICRSIHAANHDDDSNSMEVVGRSGRDSQTLFLESFDLINTRNSTHNNALPIQRES